VRSGQLSATDRLYDFLTTYIAAYGYAPSYAEMAAALGWHSLSTPLYHIRKLAAAGRIEHTPRTARGLRLLGDMGAGNTPA
jgi:SOS-response transcriptional repressor LexA